MKTITRVLNGTLIICALTLLIIGCKKDQNERISSFTSNSKTVQQQTTAPSIAGRCQESISVSDYGFLVFPTVDDLEEYHQFLTKSTHVDVQRYLDSLGFHSLGASLYGEEYLDQPVTEEQAIDYVFNNDQVFQVEGVLMKPVEETTDEVKWQFLLTMTAENLSKESYEYLVAGSFDTGTMDKFATNPDEDGKPLLELIKETPAGYEETDPNSPQARRPMFGRTPGYCDWWFEFNPATGQEDKVVSYGCEKGPLYIFWIKFDKGKDCGFGDTKCV